MSTTLVIRTINLLLVVLLGVTLAQLTWRLVPTRGEVGSGPLPSPLAAGSLGVSAGTNLLQVASMHLFGEAAVQKARIPPADAPDTHLALTLRGLWSSRDGTEGYAIISDAKGEEAFYRLHSTLPGGATLAEIRPDRVILERAGRFETLRLTRDRADFAAIDIAPAGESAPPPAESGGSAQGARMAQLRERMMQDPTELTRLIHMSPVFEEGNVKGYRVSPGAERDLFEHAGLQPGDIVTTINGIPLNDASMMSQVLSQVSSADRLNLTVERAGREEQVTIDLGQQ